MGYTTSTVHGIEVPNSAEPNDVPEDIGKVVAALEGGSIIRRLTGAAIAALTAPQKPAGLVVYNTTTNRLQISDGTNFADLVDSHHFAVGTRASNQSIPDNTETTVTYTAETDAQGMLNAATGVLTVPTSGLWMFTAHLQGDPVDNLPLGYALIRGISPSVTVGYYPDRAMSFTVSALHLATAGHTFDVRTNAPYTGTNLAVARFAAVLLTRT